MPQEHIIIEKRQEHITIEMPQEHMIVEMPREHDTVQCLQRISKCTKSTIATPFCSSPRENRGKEERGVQIEQIKMRSIAWHISERAIKIMLPPRT